MTRRSSVKLQKPESLTLVLIIVCVVCYIPQMLGVPIFGAPMNYWMSVASDSLTRPWEFVTAIFAHGSLEHLAMNMVSLYWLGSLIEGAHGKAKFAILFFVSGIVGNVVFALLADGSAVGASGAVFGLLGAAAYLLYKRRDNPGARGMFQGLLAMLALNVINSFLPGIAMEAHFGGLVAGVICEAVILALPSK